jgi:hypothetical protein
MIPSLPLSFLPSRVLCGEAWPEDDLHVRLLKRQPNPSLRPMFPPHAVEELPTQHLAPQMVFLVAKEQLELVSMTSHE